jgi:hypothetical protein
LHIKISIERADAAGRLDLTHDTWQARARDELERRGDEQQTG